MQNILEQHSTYVKIIAMKKNNSPTGRRIQALSKDQIVAAAISILDNDGEKALTFRSLSSKLATGSGAIYHHVDNKDSLLAAATQQILSNELGGIRNNESEIDEIRSVALAVFEAIELHPWIGTQLALAPWQPAMLMIFEGIGQPLQRLGVADELLFDYFSALLNYILGVAGLNAVNGRLLEEGIDRNSYFETVISHWSALDSTAYPFIKKVMNKFANHDDQKQFISGINLILSGIQARK
jgi:AcrR family transcriptional regulator